MEELFPALIFIVIGVISAVSSSKKKREQQAAQQRRQYQSASTPAPAAKPAQPYAPIQPAYSFSDVPGQVITPTVHAHIQPDCDTHDMPGSLGVTSTEGKDPCHEEQLTLERTYDEPAKTEGGLTFSWSGEEMVKAFVMQEVLTRPTQRRAR